MHQRALDVSGVLFVFLFLIDQFYKKGSGCSAGRFHRFEMASNLASADIAAVNGNVFEEVVVYSVVSGFR